MGYGPPVFQHPDDGVPVLHQQFRFGEAAFPASEDDPFGLAESQRLPCPHGYQVPFNFGHQPESKAQDLAVDRVVKGVSLFCSMEDYPFLEAPSHDSHDFRQGPAQSGYFGDNQRVSGLQRFQEFSQLAFFLALAAACDFDDPPVDRDVFLFREPFVTLK